jgi:DNA-binding CsgD family transcriptional regulator
MDRHEYYDFLARHDLRYVLGASLFRSRRHMAVFSVQRPPRAGHASEEEIAAFATLVPHFQRALLLHASLVDLRARNDALIDALDRLPAGVIVADRAARVLSMNRAARALTARSDGIESAGDGLRAAVAGETAQLRRLIAEAASPWSRSRGGDLRLTRPSGKAPLPVRVFPAGAENPEALSFSTPAAVLFVTDPERRNPPRPEVLARLYGLSAGQSTLLAALASGRNLTDASKRLGLSRAAARKQLERLLRKTGCRRQADLVRLVVSGPASLM